MKHKFVSFGKILNFHGIKGEIKLGYSRGREDFVAGLKEVYLQTVNGDFLPLTFQYIKFTPKAAIAKFKEFDNINDIMPYKGCSLFIEKQAANKSLDEDEFLINDLIGMEVYQYGVFAGVVTGVSNNGASDLLSVKTKSDNISLVPFVKAIVTDVNIKSRKIVLADLEGLLE